MKCLLLVEDQPKDLTSAVQMAKSLGVDDVQARDSASAARAFLERGLKGEVPLPNAIVLDLDLGIESGFELLRFWHSTPRLTEIPLMIWSQVDQHREICELFKVRSFVSKWQGINAFREALGNLVC